MKVRIFTDPETVDLMSVQVGAWVFGFFTGVAAALALVWLITVLW